MYQVLTLLLNVLLNCVILAYGMWTEHLHRTILVLELEFSNLLVRISLTRIWLFLWFWKWITGLLADKKTKTKDYSINDVKKKMSVTVSPEYFILHYILEFSWSLLFVSVWWCFLSISPSVYWCILVIFSHTWNNWWLLHFPWFTN